MNNKQLPFVGEDRRKLLGQLLDHYQTVKESKKPMWVSLEAESGWGKTRLMQELYSTLAASQETEYWPKTILETYENKITSKLSDKRKLLFPSLSNFGRAPCSLPDYMFWGINCAERAGAPLDVILEDLEQIKIHQPYITYKAALQKETKLSSVVDIFKKVGSHDVTDRIESVIKGALEEFIGGFPLGNAMLKTSKVLIRSVNEHLEKREAFNASGIEPKKSLSDDAFKLVSNIPEMGTPLIVCIEDLHLASEEMTALLVRLVTDVKLPILVITTTWPGRFERIANIASVIENLQPIDQLQRYSSLTNLANGTLLENLTNTGKADLVRSYFPNCADDLLDTIIQHYTNPLAIELLCTLPRWKGNELLEYPIPLKEANNYPRTVKAWCEDAWNKMDEDSHKSLIYSALSIPAKYRSWVPEFVEQCMDETIDYAKKIRGEVDGWVKIDTHSELSFTDEIMREMASSYVDDYLGGEAIEQFYRALADQALSFYQNHEHSQCLRKMEPGYAFEDSDSEELSYKQVLHVQHLIYTLYEKGCIEGHVSLVKESMLFMMLNDFDYKHGYSDFAQKVMAILFELFMKKPLITKDAAKLDWVEDLFLVHYLGCCRQKHSLEEFVELADNILAQLNEIVVADSLSTKQYIRHYISSLKEEKAYSKALELLFCLAPEDLPSLYSRCKVHNNENKFLVGCQKIIDHQFEVYQLSCKQNIPTVEWMWEIMSMIKSYPDSFRVILIQLARNGSVSKLSAITDALSDISSFDVPLPNFKKEINKYIEEYAKNYSNSDPTSLENTKTRRCKKIKELMEGGFLDQALIVANNSVEVLDKFIDETQENKESFKDEIEKLRYSIYKAKAVEVVQN